MEEGVVDKKKSHSKPHAGRKAEKKKKNQIQEKSEGHRNPKAFTFNSAVRAERTFRRKQDLQSKKHHVPVIDRTPVEPPPILVAVVGPPKVGKSLLIQCLIKIFTKQPLSTIKGPVTVVSGKKRRITFIECNNDINSMIDIAKVADLVLLLIDASFGFEMEIFEFLNICQVHGMPKIMGVLTHLDLLKHGTALKKAKKTLKHRFWTEVYAGAKLFYLSGVLHREYLRNEVKNLGRFISVMKFRPLTWQTTHPYLIADRLEDLTSPELIRQNDKTDRVVSIYGYVRGIPLNKNCHVHIPGCGDFPVKDVSYLPDPCPLPDRLKKRSLGEKERLIYAPFSGVGGIVYDKDAVYIELAGGNQQNKNSQGPTKEFVSTLLETKETVDLKMEHSELQLFTGAAPITASEFVNETNLPEGLNVEHVHENGRDRRKVIFCDNENSENESKMETDSDGEDTDEDLEGSDVNSDDDNVVKSSKTKISKEKSGNENLDSDEEMEDNEDESDEESSGESLEQNSSVKWKENLAQKATNSFLERQANSASLWKLVYGEKSSVQIDDKLKEEDDNGEDTLNEGLFRLVKQREEEKILEKDSMNIEDVTARFVLPVKRDWSKSEVCDSIRDCFVTGKWKKTEDAFGLTKMIKSEGGIYDDDDGDEEDDEMYGDFEDLETGKKHEGEKDIEKNKEEVETSKDVTKEELIAKKKRLKEKFDMEYDDKDGNGGEKSYYDDLKEEAAKQSELNRAQFDGLDEDLRIQLEGFRPGLYVRIEFENVPCELVTYFDPTYPLIVGSLQPGEQNIGFVKARVKKHRWYDRILKTSNPLIISLGWRRFQTIPIYSKLEDNLRHRRLKYTPEHVACMAHFYGPITRAGTGLLAVQDVAARQVGFRIAATGSIVDTNQTTEVTKKLKLTGVPMKIYKKTAFITGMFNSVLEVAKFEGARIKTVSGIKGQIKKAVNKPEGCFRATFEDKIKLSDIVFCRTWYKVDVPQLYNPVTSLLLPPSEKSNWKGMRTLGELKLERGIKNDPEEDSRYTEIQRNLLPHRPFVVPRKLQKELPYKDKPKNRHLTKKNKPDKIPVIRDIHEAKVASMMTKLKINYKAKMRQMKRETVQRLKEHRKKIRLEEEGRTKRMKEDKREYFRRQSKMEKKQSSKTR